MRKNLKMKIEELKHINIGRRALSDKDVNSYYYSEKHKALQRKNGYIPTIDCMSDSYSIIANVLDKDCVVAYVTDNSTTTFLIKTSRQFVGFVCLSEKLTKYLSSNSTRRITRLKNWRDTSDKFSEVTSDEDLVIVDKDLYEKYFKTKLLEKLENG